MSNFKEACIIDDDPIYRFGLQRLMQQVEFSDEILVYEDGQEAMDGLMDRLERNEPLPPIILLDLDMPHKDGWEFLDEFLRIPNHNRESVVIYINSSSINVDDQIRAKRYGLYGNYIVKPIGAEDLRKIISRHLDRP